MIIFLFGFSLVFLSLTDASTPEEHLYQGIKDKESEMILEGIMNGADVNHRYENGLTPVLLAIRENVPAAVGYLSGHDSELNPELNHLHGLTAFQYACKLGRHEIVELMIRYGFEMFETDARGWFPIHYAAAGTTAEHVITLEYLMIHGAHIGQETNDGVTPYNLATTPEMRKLIRSFGGAPEGVHEEEEDL